MILDINDLEFTTLLLKNLQDQNSKSIFMLEVLLMNQRDQKFNQLHDSFEYLIYSLLNSRIILSYTNYVLILAFDYWE